MITAIGYLNVIFMLYVFVFIIMLAALNVIENFAYPDWDVDTPTVPVDVFDDLTDEELIALPADVQMAAYRRCAQGGLIVEGGDETASVEILKRIPNEERKPIDISCSFDEDVIDVLPAYNNPYCNTEFAFPYVPPRVAEPRLPASENATVMSTGVEFSALSGLAKCLSSAIEVVHLQRLFGGDATKLANYYAALWGLDQNFFFRPFVGPPNVLSDVDLIAAYDDRQYLTYLDPAWQAVIKSSRPALDSSAFGPRAMIHWDRVFFLARLQYIKGLLATPIPIKRMVANFLTFRVDATIVHKHHPRPHTLALPDGFSPQKPVPALLLKYIEKTVRPLVEEAIRVSISIELGGIATGNVGSLQLVAPTTIVNVRRMPTDAEIRSSIRKVEDAFSRDRYIPVPGISLMAVITRLLDQLDVLHEVHLFTFATIKYLIGTIETVPTLKTQLAKKADVAHILATEHAAYVGNRYGDSKVHGFLTALSADTVRERETLYTKQYASMFGHRWELSLKYGNYARIIQIITYMAIEEALGKNRDYHVCGRISYLVASWRSKLHKGVYLGTPKQVAYDARTLSKQAAHERLLESMRNVYGKLLDMHIMVCQWLMRLHGGMLDGLRWVAIVQATKRRLLSCIKWDAGANKIITANDEVRRTLIALIKDRTSVVPQVVGTYEDVWIYIAKNIKAADWVISKGARRSVIKVKRAIELKAWFEEMCVLHAADHAELEGEYVKLHTLPEEVPVVKQPAIVDEPGGLEFGNFEIGQPEISGKLRMYSELVDRVEGDEALDFLETLDIDSIADDVWVAAMRAFDTHGQSMALQVLRESGEDLEIRH